MLDDPTTFAAALDKLESGGQAVRLAQLHCPTCGGPRVHQGTVAHPYRGAARPGSHRTLRETELVLIVLNCSDCLTMTHAVRYFFDKKEFRIALLGTTLGGLSTPNTPEAVKYYLDQAHNSQAVSANSAAVAMYRAALEQLLHDQGFTNGMLDAKIKELEKSQAASPLKWVRDLEPAFLKALKDLGNGAIHTNGGDVTKQAALDTETLTAIKAVFMELLDAAYEIPARKKANLAKLQGAAKAVGK